MSEEATRSGGLWMPYPLLAIFMTCLFVFGGGIIALYSQLSAMNATMIMRDADYSQRTNKLEEKLELQDMKIGDLKDRIVRAEAKSQRSN